jgi:hypothetical protein
MFPKKIAVLLWLFHTDLWGEFYNQLSPLQDHIHLYLGLDSKALNKQLIVDQARDSFNNIDINYYPNAGGDILPFLNQISELSNNQHDIFLKLHSKKSELFNYMNWRVVLLESLIGNENKFLRNIEFFENEKIGCVSNKSLTMHNHEHKNKKQIQNLCQLLNIDYEKYNNGQFSAGTMFFGKVSLFQQYFNTNTLPILSDLLKNEIGHVTDCLEGRYCHGLERIFGYLVSANSLEFRFSIEEKFKILNNLAPNKKLHIIRLYNNHCYAEEDIHVYGHILKETESLITIKWWHLKNPVTKDYKKINSNTLVRIP